MIQIAPLEKYFWDRVGPPTPEGCWQWEGIIDRGRNRGYGVLFSPGGVGCKKQYAHRVSFMLHKGEIPKHLQIDHICRKRDCVNPSHLELVTVKENILRGEGLAAINSRKTHCINGHEYAPPNLYYTKSSGVKYRRCRECDTARSKTWTQNNRERERARLRAKHLKSKALRDAEEE